ncbi:lipopolysaccharide kinase InaA [Jejubacter calystegiae]|uniref:Lipopolysaccharide kinase InaA n=1 Tax=Jejubacter calystegiae TaxID=2579935 RepID=A0A4P8YPQ4_9ENTR|nr:lipopolysaccharide kinase InaA [Jejubacter calystegiae]QCT21988.1 lipopolysaccharide kinase InaA [Jejubacter calystegiae]
MLSQQEIQEFDAWWATEGEWVEEPNQRRNGMSGVQRIERDGKALYVKRMTRHLFHSLRYPFGRPTIVREIQVLNELACAGVNVPKIIYGKALKRNGEWRALLVTEEMAGFCSIDRWYSQHASLPFEDETRQEMLRQIALAFRGMHSINRQHGCCYVRHIFVKTSGQIEAGFLDLEKSRRRWVRSKAVNHDFRQLEKYLSPIPVQDWQQVKAFYYAL